MAVGNMRFLTSDKEPFSTKDSVAFYTADTYSSVESEQIDRPYPIFVLDGSVTKIYGTVEPFSCIVTQEKNGRYDLELDAIYSEEYGAHFLQGLRVLNVPIIYHGKLRYQYFRIYTVSRSTTSSGMPRIKVEARHIFYDLSWKKIPTRFNKIRGTDAGDKALADIGALSSDGIHIAGTHKQIFDLIMNAIMHYTTPVNNYTKKFTYKCTLPGAGTSAGIDQSDPVSIVSVLLNGENSFIEQTSGRLYRDNFYFSIGNKTEGCKNTGQIIYSQNMTGINCETSFDDFCTRSILFSKNQSISSLNTNDSTSSALMKKYNLPMDIQKYALVEYPDIFSDMWSNLLDNDFKRISGNLQQPSINLSVSFADLKNNSLYGQFSILSSCEVGDELDVYHEDLDIVFNDIEVISKTYDVLKSEVLGVELGNFRKSLAREVSYQGTITTY